MKRHDVAIVPSFFTSAASLKNLIKGGIDWPARQSKLILDNQVFYLLGTGAVEQVLGLKQVL
jgi:hypothetical protein